MPTTVTASTSLVEYLAGKGVRAVRASGPEVVTACWWCNDGNPRKRKLYLNTETWQYFCQVCNEKGGRTSLLTYFGDQDRDELRYAPGTDPAMRRKVLGEGALLAQEMLMANPEVVRYLTEERGLDAQTIVDAGFGYAPTSWGLGRMLTKTNDRRDVMHAGFLNSQGQEFFSGHILIPYYSHGVVEGIRGKVYVPGRVNGKYVSTDGDKARLYGIDDLLGAKRVLFVEGEFDKQVLRQALRASGLPEFADIAVVGFAGANSWPIGMEHMLDGATRIYTGLDPDEAGDIARDRLKTMFGPKVREIDLPRDLPKCDWTEFLSPRTEKNPHGGHDWRHVRDLIEQADAKGRRLFTIRDTQREMRRLEKSGTTGVPTGFANLDIHLGAGVKPGQLLIPLARQGTGKTSFLTSVTYNCRHIPTLVVSLEMTALEYYDKLRKTALFWDPLLTEEGIADLYQHVRIYDGTLRPGDLTRLCEEFVEEQNEDPRLVMVDYIGYAAKNFPGGSPYDRTTNAVMTLKEEGKAGKFSLIAPHQAGRPAAGGVPVNAEHARDSGAIEDTADILLGLFRPGDADPRSVSYDVTAGVLKNRNGRIGVQANLVFGMASQILVSKGTPEGLRADDENRLIIQGESEQSIREIRRRNALAAGIHQPVLSP